MQTVGGQTMPGWRDAERAVAAAFSGLAPEGKGVFDVLIPSGDSPLPYGLSIKTSRITSEIYVLSELHNSAKKAHDRLNALGLDWNEQAKEAGDALIHQVIEWHEEERRLVDVARSSYLHLVHDSTWTQWRILWFPLTLLEPNNLLWERAGQRITGYTPDGYRLWEWYGQSGGQLKWYPKILDATWDSGYFLLEPAPPSTLASKAQTLYADLWPVDEQER
ncbi:hypothetical protein [Planctomonas psychrotolerans]|uniref:hypothetical protein n=1 Tax=Planctomonas psychrotolerans TaxID=2528712 RepID=UPI00123A11CD|nr:hypothetical protein [Planctomonas psychrotolerans]